MLGTRLIGLAIGLLALTWGAAPAAQAGVQMYNGSWVADSFGNDRVAATAGVPTSHMGTGASQFFSVFGMPQGILCNPQAPRCNFSSSPTSKGVFNAQGLNCQPLTNALWSMSTRPAKGGTATSKGQPLNTAPRYRNPFFFTGGGLPKVTSCTATTTVGLGSATQVLTTNDPLRGIVMKGNPLTGMGVASTFTVGSGGAFTFAAAPATKVTVSKGWVLTGFRRTTVGEFNNIPPYLYSYTYATLRNASGFFSKGGGFFTTGAAPTTLSLPYTSPMGAKVAKAVISDGPNRFGGVMRLLGQLTTKVCYFRNGGCSLGGADWLYQYIGTSAPVAGGVVTAPYQKKTIVTYYHTNLMQTSMLSVKADRFPWTTGTVTLTAIGRGPHKTIERRAGYDSRSSTNGQGKMQLVSPILTHWVQNCCKFETGGIAVLRLEFLPEPRYWMMLVGGLSMLGVLYRFRGR